MKKSLAIISLIAAVCLLLTGCAPTVDYSTNLDAYVKTLDYHDGFTVLQLSDIHWSTATQIGNNDCGQYRFIKKVINEAKEHAGKIDLIEITGDTFMLANKSTVQSFIGLMTEIAVPYAIVWGNHDHECKYNASWLKEQFEKAPYCLYTEVANDNIYGRSNYVINLVSDGGTKWQIFNFDSGSGYRRTSFSLTNTYDYLREEQFAWMTAEHEAAGGNVPSLCYYHIPQLEMAEAYEKIKNGNTEYKAAFNLYEGFGESEYAFSTEEIFLRNNVKAVFTGHCHNNDWTVTFPSGIIYGFGVKTGQELYYYESVPDTEDSGYELTGASLLTLVNSDGDLELEHLYYNERTNGDFKRWVSYEY